ncbi:MAG: hypothetical protein EOO80_19090, partial [Oxalobacteraceae bacterium]
MSLNTPINALLALAVLQMLAGCATARADPAEERAGKSAPAPARSLEVVIAQPGVESRLRRGQVLAFELYGNASTGYGWEVIEDGSPVLVPVKGPPAAKPTIPPMPGSGS